MSISDTMSSETGDGLSSLMSDDISLDGLTSGGGGDADNSDFAIKSQLDETSENVSENSSNALKASETISLIKEHDVPEEESAQADKVQNELDKELKENDGWLKILGNDEIMKKVVKAGVQETRPLRGEICTIRIEGRLQNDETVVFESEEKFIFQLGDVEVITGLDMAIPLMCKGEVAIIKVSPRFAYGTKGLDTRVPPNSYLIYDIELIDFENEKDLVELTVTERRQIGNRKRERGNWWYTRGESSLSIQCYRRALEFLDEAEGGIQYPSDNTEMNKVSVSDELKELFEDRIKTLNNMAQAQLKLQAYEPALNSVDAVLKCQPQNVKALFRKGKILAEKGSTETALEILRTANRLEPDNKAVLQEISQLTQRQKKEHYKEKLLYKRMFNKDSNDKSSDSDKSIDKESGTSSYKSVLTAGLVLSGVAVAAAGVLAYRGFRQH